MPPTAGLTDQVTRLFVWPLMLATKGCVVPCTMVALAGASIIVPATNAKVAVAVLPGSPWLIAVIVTGTLPDCGGAGGAVYMPCASMVPGPDVTTQFTADGIYQPTAVNWTCLPIVRPPPLAGVTVIRGAEESGSIV